MTKRSISIILVLSLLFIFSSCARRGEEDIQSTVSSASEADSVFEEAIDLPKVIYVPDETDLTYVQDYFADVPHVGLYNGKTLEAFYTQSAHVKIYPASLTKMVTAAVALRYGSLDDVYRVGSELYLVQPHSSLFGLQLGMELTLQHLLYGMLLPSGNDAAYTVAVNVARGIRGNEELGDTEAVEYFCGLMNDYCASIGALNSHFTNPEGWDDENQYTTVHDLAVIAANAMRNDIIAGIVRIPEMRILIESGETFIIGNSNLLLHNESDFYNPNCIGVKTGSTDLAGACLVACVTVENSEYILVAANSPSRSLCFSTVNELYEFAKRYHHSAKSILPDKLGK